MNFRKHAEPRVLGFLIAPMVDILLVVLVFFIVTWNFALSENELDVRVPTATKANEAQPYVGQVVINIAANGTVDEVRSSQHPRVRQFLDRIPDATQDDEVDQLRIFTEGI